MVQRQFESLFPGRVLRVHMAHDTREIDSLVSEYWRLRRKLLDQLDDYSEQRKRLQPVKPAQARLWLHTLCVRIHHRWLCRTYPELCQPQEVTSVSHRWDANAIRVAMFLSRGGTKEDSAG